MKGFELYGGVHFMHFFFIFLLVGLILKYMNFAVF
jgi:hypothetical protein